ncbi:hypothetical protein U0070_022950 [Myodes glareolus]|uniref:Uncharacterized protein n=1 Tax=Myodes glareolus TaxID=447135 RepID=A0AAW0H3L0_MYOGA
MVNYHTTMTPMLRGTAPQGTQNPQLAQPFVHLGIPVGRELCVNRKLAAMGARMQSLLPRLIVENLFCPVTLDVLHQIRSKFGTVSNLFTFTKNNQFWVRLQQADRGCPAYQAVPGRSESLQRLLCSAHRLLQDHQSQRQIQQQELRLHSASPAPWGQPVFAGPDHGCSIWYAQCNSGYSSLSCAEPSAAAAAMAGHIAIPDLVAAKNSVLLVSNLNLERVTPQGPCILSGVYGDMQRVKILLDKENAPVQHQSVQLPREGQEDHDLTKDSSSSLLSASRSPGSKNFQNFSHPQSPFTSPISRPLCQRMTQRASSPAADSVVKGFKFFQKDHKVALTQMGSGEEAVRR